MSAASMDELPPVRDANEVDANPPPVINQDPPAPAQDPPAPAEEELNQQSTTDGPPYDYGDEAEQSARTEAKQRGVKDILDFIGNYQTAVIEGGLDKKGRRKVDGYFGNERNIGRYYFQEEVEETFGEREPQENVEEEREKLVHRHLWWRRWGVGQRMQ